jgi:hypothetical protein
MKIFLDFYEKVMREDTFKLKTWNKSLYESNNVNRVIAVKLCHYRDVTNNYQVKCSHSATLVNAHVLLQVGRHKMRLITS